MALYQVVKNNASAAQDLNQVVNLLNGTTTNTQVTVANRISAQMTGATQPSALVGGTFLLNGPPASQGTFIAGDAAVSPVGGNLWACYSPSGVGNPQGLWSPGGTGGFVARWYQANAQGLNQGTTVIALDTQSFDTYGLYSTAPTNGWVIPMAGWYEFVGSVAPYADSTYNYRFAPMILKNGSEAARGDDTLAAGNSACGTVMTQLACVTGDVISLACYVSVSTTRTNAYSQRTFFTIRYVSGQVQ